MRYRELFTIEMLHDYFADGAARDIAIVPTSATRRVLAGCGLIAKQSGNRLFVVAPTDDGLSPRIAPAEGTEFCFMLEAGSSDFYSMSNVQFNAASGERFMFSNRGGGVADGRMYLHAQNALFNAGNAYAAGSFVRDGGGDCFEALADLAPGSSLGNAAQWRNVGAVAYADSAAVQQVCGDNVRLEVNPPSEVVSTQVFAFNPASGLFDVLRQSTAVPYSTTVSQHVISLADLSDDIYRITVNGSERMVYHRSRPDWQQAFGVARVFTGGGEAATHRVLNPDGTFISPVFSLRIAPLSVLWQYNARTDRVQRVFDSAAAIAFTAVAPRIFRSTLPQRLREQAYQSITIEYNDTNPLDPSRKIDIPMTAVPGFRNSERVLQNGTNYFANHVILNY